MKEDAKKKAGEEGGSQRRREDAQRTGKAQTAGRGQRDGCKEGFWRVVSCAGSTH